MMQPDRICQSCSDGVGWYVPAGLVDTVLVYQCCDRPHSNRELGMRLACMCDVCSSESVIKLIRSANYVLTQSVVATCRLHVLAVNRKGGGRLTAV